MVSPDSQATTCLPSGRNSTYRPVQISGASSDRAKKLFQFLNEIGARALRIHLGRVLEMAESSDDQLAYESKIVERFGGQRELDLVMPPPPAVATLGGKAAN